MKPPLVLDTCALIAGLLKPHGASGLLVDAFFHDQLKLAWTGDIIAEYGEVMGRAEFGIELRERVAVVLKLRSSGVRVTPLPVPEADWPDVDDLPFVAAALATESKIIVTLNPRDFAPAPGFGILILTPGEALKKLRAGEF
ncbi:PIN domain-containing protein [Geminisphaera colitermitum]|uniref:PIN domain-containing protein n=1 Tax=Geminisphaera colitermitum TaxID=1148786 RepID=UPI000158CF4B|nr:PIN domain-containing protein [Geminisphaera colitermitum]